MNLRFLCLDLRKTCNGNFRLDAWAFLEEDGEFFMVDGCRPVHGPLTFAATVALGRIEFPRFQGLDFSVESIEYEYSITDMIK